MRVLFNLSITSWGGLEVLTVNIVKKLKEKGICPALLITRVSSSGLNLLNDSKVVFFLSHRKSKFNFQFMFNFYKIMRHFKPDIVVSLSEFNYFFLEIVRKFLKPNIPHVLAFHSLRQIAFKDIILTKFFIFFSKLCRTHYIFVSGNQYNKYQRDYGIQKNMSFLIYNGIDTDFFHPPTYKESNIFTIAHVANIRPEKDQWTLLKALKIINETIKDWKLIFVGADRLNLANEFKAYLQENRISGNVDFYVGADQKLIKKILSISHVFVLSSISEAFPVSALEAMAMGLPCILTDVGGCPEIVTDGYNGYLVKPKKPQVIADKLAYLYKNPDILREVGENARKTVLEKFSLEICAKKYLELFTNVINVK
jgi:glycosyltransferase involved in cell wall biosynthesis